MSAGGPSEDRLPAILLVPSASIPSGVATYVLGEARAISSARCAVAAVPGSALADSLAPNCSLVSTGGDLMGMVRSLAGHRRDFDFIQAHGPRALLAATLARVPSRRLGYVFHEIEGPRAPVELRLARRALLAANGPGTAAWASRQLATEVDTLYPLVEASPRVARAAARAQLGLTQDALVIGVVGRLSGVKSPLLAVEAVAQSGLAATLAFIGDGPERKAIIETAGRLGVPIALPGTVANAAQLMGAFDVLMSCSSRESFGLAAAEAIMADLPLVAVDSPGLRLLTDEGRLAPLLPPSADVLGAALGAAVAQPNRNRILRDHVACSFGPAAYAAAIGDHCTKAIRRARA